MTIQSINTEDMNRRISFLNQQIDEQAITSSNYPNLPNIYSYYTLLDQLYININYLLNSKYRLFINQNKKCFFEIYHKIQIRNMDENEDAGMSPQEGLLMISYLKKINNGLIRGLQKHGYFVSTENEKDDSCDIEDYYDLADYYKEKNG